MSARKGGAIRIRSACAKWLPLGLALGVLAAAVPAEAQITPFGVALSATATELTATDMACVRSDVTVTNTGQSPVPPSHTIAIEATGPGAGWRVSQAPPESVTLAAQASTRFPIEICPDESIDDGATTTYTISATVTSDQISAQPASDQLEFTIRATEDGPFGLDIPNSALWIALAGIAALVALVLLTRSRSSGGVAVSCPEASKTVPRQ